MAPKKKSPVNEPQTKSPKVQKKDKKVEKPNQSPPKNKPIRQVQVQPPSDA